MTPFKNSKKCFQHGLYKTELYFYLPAYTDINSMWIKEQM